MSIDWKYVDSDGLPPIEDWKLPYVKEYLVSYTEKRYTATASFHVGFGFYDYDEGIWNIDGQEELYYQHVYAWVVLEPAEMLDEC